MCDKNVILIRKVLVLISKQREAGKTAKKKVGGWFWEITDKSFFGSLYLYHFYFLRVFPSLCHYQCFGVQGQIL